MTTGPRLNSIWGDPACHGEKRLTVCACLCKFVRVCTRFDIKNILSPTEWISGSLNTTWRGFTDQRVNRTATHTFCESRLYCWVAGWCVSAYDSDADRQMGTFWAKASPLLGPFPLTTVIFYSKHYHSLIIKQEYPSSTAVYKQLYEGSFCVRS